MNTLKLLVSTVAIAAGFGVGTSSVWAKDGVLDRQRLGNSNYCHMHFPAIDEKTLSWDRPVLKNSSSGDVIHFYGSCDYDPHGKEAAQSQRLERARERRRAAE